MNYGSNGDSGGASAIAAILVLSFIGYIIYSIYSNFGENGIATALGIWLFPIIIIGAVVIIFIIVSILRN